MTTNIPKKEIILTMDDGRKFAVDCHPIAHDRASHYAKTDAENTTYQEEYDYTMGDDYELYDWLLNNMDWYELPYRELDTDRQPLCDLQVDSYEVVNNA